MCSCSLKFSPKRIKNRGCCRKPTTRQDFTGKETQIHARLRGSSGALVMQKGYRMLLEASYATTTSLRFFFASAPPPLISFMAPLRVCDLRQDGFPRGHQPAGIAFMCVRLNPACSCVCPMRRKSSRTLFHHAIWRPIERDPLRARGCTQGPSWVVGACRPRSWGVCLCDRARILLPTPPLRA